MENYLRTVLEDGYLVIRKVYNSDTESTNDSLSDDSAHSVQETLQHMDIEDTNQSPKERVRLIEVNVIPNFNSVPVHVTCKKSQKLWEIKHNLIHQGILSNEGFLHVLGPNGPLNVLDEEKSLEENGVEPEAVLIQLEIPRFRVQGLGLEEQELLLVNQEISVEEAVTSAYSFLRIGHFQVFKYDAEQDLLVPAEGILPNDLLIVLF
jgi:hypothetical protein